MKPIPIRNLYYLLAYAWDQLRVADLAPVAEDDFADVSNLFARVLVGGVDRLLKQGLDRGYVERAEVVAGVRGRVRFAETVRGNLLAHGRTCCVVADLTADVLHNRLIAQTLRDLLSGDELHRRVAGDVRACLRRLGSLTPIDVRSDCFDRVQLHGNNGVYRFLLDVCRLVHDCVGVDQSTGRRTFRDFHRDDGPMARLFERFVLNFYRREQARYAVRSLNLPWADATGHADHLAMLPGMRTDVFLSAADRRIVVDTKYYLTALQGHFGKDTVRSGHLYQMYAYLRNVRSEVPSLPPVEGVLLYPLVGTAVDVDVVLHGHRLRAVTVDLAATWQAIRGALLALVD